MSTGGTGPFLEPGSSVVWRQPTPSATSGRGAPRLVKLFVLDPHTIYRRGLAACLALMDEVESVAHAGTVREAWEDRELFECELVILDQSIEGGLDFIAAMGE